MSKRIILRADDKTLSKNISGKVYIVTGANSGVGLETTRQLVKQGGHVIMACRRIHAAEEAAKSFAELKGSYEVMKLDLNDLPSVRDFVSAFLKKHNKLHGLVCNAGLVNMTGKVQYTKDDLETTMAANYFGHFLLTELLLDILKKSTPSRMIILSSVVHAGNKKKRPEVHLDDLNYRSREFKGFAAYSEAKVATVLYAMELAERLKGTGISAFSVHPGWARSNFGSGGGFFIRMLMAILRPLTMSMSDSNEDAAQTSLHCLLSDTAADHSGAYFSQSSVLYQEKECKNGGWPLVSPNPNARNMGTAKKLVEISKKIVGLEA